MTINIGVVMDPIAHINTKKDTTLAFLLAAQKRGWAMHYMEQQDLYVKENTVSAAMCKLTVQNSPQHWYALDSAKDKPLNTLDVILMRVDPPFNLEYIYTTYLLELAQKAGVLVINDPQSLRDANEKFFTTWFPQCIPPTLVTRDARHIHHFISQHQDVILKPLSGMGGRSVFRIRHNDPNINVIIETLSDYGACTITAQSYIPAITEQGDKRILLIDGEPVPYALARMPGKDDPRGNLAAGATGIVVELTDRDRWICAAVGPVLRQKGLVFVGLDVIGDYLTEINVTSPTCVREIEAECDINISDRLLECIAAKLAKKKL